MAEIILSADEDLQPQLRTILDLADELGIGHSQITTPPRATTSGTSLPHGIVVGVPDELAEAYAERRAAVADEADSDGKPTRRRASKAIKAAEKKAEATPTEKADGQGDSGEQTKE